MIAAKKRLEDAGIEVLVTDHHIIRSIYFFDPNGIRIELTVRAIEEEEMKRLGGDDLSIPLADRQRGADTDLELVRRSSSSAAMYTPLPMQVRRPAARRRLHPICQPSNPAARSLWSPVLLDLVSRSAW